MRKHTRISTYRRGGSVHGTTVQCNDKGLLFVSAASVPLPFMLTCARFAIPMRHKGGYSYRLCPLGENLTEACFQQRPLDFVGQSKFRWGGAEGRTLSFDAVTVGGDQTTPKGSMCTNHYALP